jgi:uncharacterized membrane protein YagU involved in acid resistance
MITSDLPSLKLKSPAKTILLSGFTAGTMDILAAFFVYSVLMQVVTPVQILLHVASGVFGKTIIGNETTTALIGLLFHFIIALGFATAYFLIYPYIKFLHYNKIISGILYGMLVWLIMNFVVVPLSNASHAPFALNSAIRAAIILILCIGLPISFITVKYYERKT